MRFGCDFGADPYAAAMGFGGGGDTPAIVMESAPASALLSAPTASDFLATVAGVGKWDFGTDCSFVLLWRNNSHTAGDQCPLSMSDGTSGFWIDVLGGGQTYIQFRAAGNTPIACGYHVAHGWNCLAATHLAGGSVRASLNGITAFQAAAAPTYTALGTNGRVHLGRAHASIGTYPATKAQLVAVVFLNRALSDAELQAASSCDRVDSWHLPIASDASVERVIRIEDWSGSGDFTTGGVTYAKNGSAAKTALPAEYVYTPTGDWFHDSPATETPVARLSLARLKFTTSATQVAFDVWQNNASLTNVLRAIGLHSAGAWVESKRWNQVNSVQRLDFATSLSASSKTIETTDSIKQEVDASDNCTGFGVKRIRVPQSTPATFVRPSSPASKLVLVTDSIFIQTQTLTPNQQCAAAQIRAAYPGEVATYCAGFGAWYYTCRTTTDRAKFVARVKELMGSSATKTLVIALGTNDCAINPWAVNQSSPDFTAYKACITATLQDLHAAVPDMAIRVYLPILRTTDTYQPAWRTAISDACVGLPSVTVVHAENWTITKQGDGIHPSDTGHTELAAYVKTDLGY